MSARRCALKRAADTSGVPRYASDIRPIRGTCRRRRCASRYGVVRVTADFCDPRALELFAAVECVECGRVWYRVRRPAVRSRAGYQSVRLTLILPAASRRWFARGRWHKSGEDCIVVRDAGIAEFDDAAAAHGARLARREASRARAAEKVAATANIPDSPAHRAYVERIAALDALAAEREAEERAAAQREAE